MSHNSMLSLETRSYRQVRSRTHLHPIPQEYSSQWQWEQMGTLEGRAHPVGMLTPALATCPNYNKQCQPVPTGQLKGLGHLAVSRLIINRSRLSLKLGLSTKRKARLCHKALLVRWLQMDPNIRHLHPLEMGTRMKLGTSPQSYLFTTIFDRTRVTRSTRWATYHLALVILPSNFLQLTCTSYRRSAYSCILIALANHSIHYVFTRTSMDSVSTSSYQDPTQMPTNVSTNEKERYRRGLAICTIS